MNLRRRHRAHVAVEAGALSDILFFMLLFFLIISTLASPSAIRLMLPRASTGKTVPRQVIQVSVRQDGTHYIGGRQIAPERLRDELTIEARGMDNPSVVLRMDRNLQVEQLVSVVDAVNQAKLPLVLATEKAR